MLKKLLKLFGMLPFFVAVLSIWNPSPATGAFIVPSLFLLIGDTETPGGVNILENPGFETGFLSPWSTEQWSVVTTSPHSGAYCATATAGELRFIQQTFSSVPAESISSVTLWSRQFGEGALSIDMMYHDGSSSQGEIDPDSSWREFDITPLLESEKSLAGIRIWGSNTAETFIDDISIVSNAHVPLPSPLLALISGTLLLAALRRGRRNK